MIHKPVHACNTYIIEAYHFITVHLCSQGCFLCYSHVAGSSGCHDDFSHAVRLGNLPYHTGSGNFIIMQVQKFPYIVCRLFAHSGNQHGLFFFFYHSLGNFYNLFLGLSCTINNLCHTLTDTPVCVQLGKSHIFIRFCFYLKHSLFGLYASAGNLFQQFLQVFFIHFLCSFPLNAMNISLLLLWPTYLIPP